MIPARPVVFGQTRTPGTIAMPGHTGWVVILADEPLDVPGQVLQPDRPQEDGVRVRRPPERPRPGSGCCRPGVVVYLLLAGCLFAELGYRQVWHKLTVGLGKLPVASPGDNAPWQRLATGGGNTQAPVRRPGRRTCLERGLYGGRDELRGLCVDDNVPAEQDAADDLPGVPWRVVQADGGGGGTGGIGLGHTPDCRRNQRPGPAAGHAGFAAPLRRSPGGGCPVRGSAGDVKMLA